MAVCFNRALRRAKGTLIAFMDAHDLATKDKIKRQVYFLLSHSNVAAVGTRAVIIDNHGKKLSKTTLQFETTMINKMLLPKDLLRFSQVDTPIIFTDLFTKIVPYGEIANLPWVLYQKRQVENTSIKVLKLIPPVIRLWLTSFVSDYHFPIRSLFTPIIRQV